MPNRPSIRPQTADYAAVGVGPVLIFLMISSLANFFVMLFYDGGHPDRVFYLILMYTMGSVALARLVIEEDRAYSAGYAIGLGAAMLFVMTKFLGSPVFTLGLVLLIGYLADRIVHDCTLIDDAVDASGEGLIDRGLDEASGLATQADAAVETDVPPGGKTLSEKQKRRRKSHQPGRTVFLLALAALPLFGLGQFMLRHSPQVWGRAQWMLGLYLFSSLSLLVTTSFLNLRRYLRQRDVDMPTDVTIAWLAGGVTLIAALLMLAFLAPLPGAAIANISVPKFMTADNQTASRAGWGNEGAEKSEDDGDAESGRDLSRAQKEQKGSGVNQNVNSGTQGGKKAGQQAGKQQAGKQQAGKQQAGKQQAGKQQAGKQQAGKQQAGKQQAGEQQSGEQQSGEQQSGEQQSGEQQSGEQQSGEQQSGEQQKSGAKSEDRTDAGSEPLEGSEGPDDKTASEDEPSPSRDKGAANSDRETSEQADSRSEPPGDEKSEDASQGKKGSQAASKQSPSSSGELPSIPSVLPMLGGLARLLLILGLAAIVAFYLYQIRDPLALWWRSLFEHHPEEIAGETPSGIADLQDAPPRAFSSFRNPIGSEKDPRRVIVITFQAFEAWARERGWTRNQDETPSEFVDRLRHVTKQRMDAHGYFGPIDDATGRLALAYDRIVYGRDAARQNDIEAAKSIWRHMNNASVIAVTTPRPPAAV